MAKVDVKHRSINRRNKNGSNSNIGKKCKQTNLLLYERFSL